jgi:folate-binding protein YgfZ
MQSDLNLFVLAEELLLDCEPGLGRAVAERLEKYLVADDVQVVDVAALYGLLSVQGPQAGAVVRGLNLFPELPARAFDSVKVADLAAGEIYLMNHPRLGSMGRDGFDLFVPAAALATTADQLLAAAGAVGGRACGWQAFETTRIEAGLPRFGADMDETTIPLEAGLEARAVSYQKGCYIGQEVINRIHSLGHVNRRLCGLQLEADLPALPARGEKFFHDGREAGHFTSAVFSPRLQTAIALGYVRREADQSGREFTWTCHGRPRTARLVALPFC